MRRMRLGLLATVAIWNLALGLGAGGLETQEALGTSSAGAPRGVHLSFAEDPRTTMTVTWFTSGTDDPLPYVDYGATPGLGLAALAASRPAPGVDVLVHEATLRGLEPGETIHYRVSGTSGASPVRNFTTDDGDDAFTFAFLADIGTSERAAANVAALAAARPNLVVVPGDLSYANGEQPVWDEWFDLMEPLAAHVPFMTAVGNHEYEGGILEWDAYVARMALPGEELWYAFRYGNVEFVMAQSDTNALALEGRTAEHALFLDESLAAAQARKESGDTDHVMVVQHHPLYGNAAAVTRRAAPDLIASEEALLHRHSVKVLLAGHNHHYERSHPMVYAVPTATGEHYASPAGFIQVTSGGGGESLYSFQDPNDFASWSAAHGMRHHYGIAMVDGAKVEARAVDTWYTPGVVFDEWSLTVG